MGSDTQKAWNVAKPTFSLYKVVHKNTSIKHLNYQDSSFTSQKISTELDVTTQSQLILCKDLNTICQQNSDAPKLLQGSPFEPFEQEGLKRIKSRTAVYL